MWEPGTLVLCVEDRTNAALGIPPPGGAPCWSGNLDGLHKGTVYTVRESLVSNSTGMPSIRLVEIRRAYCSFECGETPYRTDRFRPITESRLSIFRSLLTETPKTVNVGEEA